jgi:hypothetical protein
MPMQLHVVLTCTGCCAENITYAALLFNRRGFYTHAQVEPMVCRILDTLGLVGIALLT